MTTPPALHRTYAEKRALRRLRFAQTHALQRHFHDQLEITRWGQGARPSQVRAAAKNMAQNLRAQVRQA